MKLGTRGCIARLTDNGFKGRYHHWDSYPSGLGKTLWNLFHGHFKEDLNAMLETLIDKHKAGWSTINGKDFNLKPGWVEYTTEDIENETRKYRQPICYCHGGRHESAWLVTEKDASGSGIEWVYAFDVKRKIMVILASYNEDNTKMIGFFGCGNESAKWQIVKEVILNYKEPDWEGIEDNVREESHKTYEAIKKRKIESFLATMKEGYANIEAFGLMAIPRAFFMSWYKEDVSEHLHYKDKIDVAMRISELTLKSPIWTDRDTNYIEQFPELKGYSNSGHISGLQLCAVMESIVKELQEGSK